MFTISEKYKGPSYPLTFLFLWISKKFETLYYLYNKKKFKKNTL